jgi:threonine aldolase
MSSPSRAIDLRSDTVTVPTPEMRRAMADAEVGDDVYGEDPTVNRLQSLAASLLGKEAALYVPSGTMANQLAIRVLAESGTEVLCPDRAHVYRYEAAAAPVNSGVQMHPLWDLPDGVRVAIEGVAHHLPRPALVVIENTYMALSGAPIDAAEMTTLCGIARGGGLPVHVDGARIWNAAVALGTAPRELVASVDTVMFCLSKGLGAPVGSLLCGPADVIDEAREYRHRWGGAMRQAGVIAAAGVVALETMVERLAEDHARARRLADALAARWPGSVDPTTVRTNIVCADLHTLPVDFVAQLERVGVRSGTLDPRTFRLVTHKDVDDDAISGAIHAFDELADAPLDSHPAASGPRSSS